MRLCEFGSPSRPLEQAAVRTENADRCHLCSTSVLVLDLGKEGTSRRQGPEGPSDRGGTKTKCHITRWFLLQFCMGNQKKISSLRFEGV